MEWKDLEKMTVLKLREEALKFPQIKNVHGKNKEQLMDEVAEALGIDKARAKISHS
jgi:hypothetical protein